MRQDRVHRACKSLFLLLPLDACLVVLNVFSLLLCMRYLGRMHSSHPFEWSSTNADVVLPAIACVALVLVWLAAGHARCVRCVAVLDI